MGWEATRESGSAEAAAALLAQVEGSDDRHKSDFFLLQQGQKFRLPRPHLWVTRGMQAPEPWGGPHLEACWLWEVLGRQPLLAFMGGGSWIILCHRAGPCWNFIHPALGLSEAGGLGHQRTAWNNTQPEGTGRCVGLGLGWGTTREDAPFLVLCGGYGRPVSLRTAFQPGIKHRPDGLDPVHG